MSLTVGMYSFDCADAAALATFWSGVLERPVDHGGTRDFATIGFDDDGPTWMFVHAEDPGTGRNRVLLDLDGGAEWRAQADRVEALGARREGEHEVPGVAHWVEFGDPEGNTLRIFAPRPS